MCAGGGCIGNLCTCTQSINFKLLSLFLKHILKGKAVYQPTNLFLSFNSGSAEFLPTSSQSYKGEGKGVDKKVPHLQHLPSQWLP